MAVKQLVAAQRMVQSRDARLVGIIAGALVACRRKAVKQNPTVVRGCRRVGKLQVNQLVFACNLGRFAPGQATLLTKANRGLRAAPTPRPHVKPSQMATIRAFKLKRTRVF